MIGNLKILLLEDNATDSEIIQRLLFKELRTVTLKLAINKKEFLEALDEFVPDVILSDNSLPGFNATEALALVRRRSLHLPFILITGTISEEFAANIIKLGADDYILKDRLKRLPSAIDAAIRHQMAEKEKTDAGEELKKSEENYRTIMERLSDGFVALDKNWNYTYLNKKAGDILGKDCDYLRGKNIWVEFPEGVGQPFYQAYHRAMETQEYARMEEYFPPWNLWLENHIYPSPEGLSIFFKDITERKKIEKDIYESEKKYRSLFLKSPLPKWIYNVETLQFVDVNEAALHHYGYTEEEFLSMTIKDIRHTDDVEALLDDISTIKNDRDIRQNNWKHLKKNGEEIIVETSSHTIEYNNRHARMVVANDITKRVKAEQKLIQSEENLKAIFDNAAEGFVLMDENWIVKDFNHKAGLTILQNSNGEIQKGRSIFEITEEDGTGALRDVLNRVMLGESIQYDRCYTKKGGTVSWTNFSFNPVKSGGSINGICATGRDITERKIAEQQKEFDSNNLNALINNTHDLLWSIDLNFNLITSNQAFNRIVSMASGKIPQKGTDILRNSFNEEQSSRYKVYYERAFAGEVFTVVEYNTFPAKFCSEISFYPIHEKGQVVGTACFAHDITNIKKTEALLLKAFEEKQVLAERMATILNTLPANIALLNEKGVIVEVNDSWKSYANANGFMGSNYAIGINYMDICKEASGRDKVECEEVAGGIFNVLSGTLSEFVFEYACHSPETKRWFRMVATPLRNKGFTGAVIMHIDISEVKKLEHERLQGKIEEQKNITRVMLQAQEVERHNIGIELHDNVNQILVGTNLVLSHARNNPDNIQELIQSSIGYLQEAIQENRKIAHVFVSPDIDESLLEQLKNLTMKMLGVSGIKISFSNEGLDERLLDKERKINIYRIAQEQCTNIVKYANASLVQITLVTANDRFYMSIQDNGSGLDTTKTPKGIGLKNIKGRLSMFNGSAEVISSPNNGFNLKIEIPLGAS